MIVSLPLVAMERAPCVTGVTVVTGVTPGCDAASTAIGLAPMATPHKTARNAMTLKDQVDRGKSCPPVATGAALQHAPRFLARIVVFFSVSFVVSFVVRVVVGVVVFSVSFVVSFVVRVVVGRVVVAVFSVLFVVSFVVRVVVVASCVAVNVVVRVVVLVFVASCVVVTVAVVGFVVVIGKEISLGGKSALLPQRVKGLRSLF